MRVLQLGRCVQRGSRESVCVGGTCLKSHITDGAACNLRSCSHIAKTLKTVPLEMVHKFYEKHIDEAVCLRDKEPTYVATGDPLKPDTIK